MNFTAIIGIVDRLSKSNVDNNHTLRVKVEKSTSDFSDEEWYDVININLDKDIFQDEITNLSKGSIVGVKGRIKLINHQMRLIGEKLQVF
jgi:hypothetical protein